ncbi:MAG: acetyl-CoA carboxylase biotin carboxylase subunit [Chloroflexaceae bacterium]|nr:acetyl-CoA carboxylase biotin carboxylase subunit [Chloroflexaceae bacterium]
MFDTVLVANRGEIALRVMRACRELNLKAIAVYSEVDRDAPHVAYADDAYLIGPSPASESYLNIERILAVARQSGAGAIHPGYGFLSENANFARAVADTGLIFVGPPPDATEALGGKVAARNVARKVGVPMVPGTLKPLESVEEAVQLAQEFGYPVAIKAVAGGGGRGLRVVRSEDEIEAAFESARREAEISFGNGELYIEKFLDNPRHIEIQILADNHGNVVYVGERDCSIQRRHQKLIEESPSPVITPEQRAEIGAAAVRLPKEVGYSGAGTLEFLYQDGQFYFLEMNSRIQVEHTVTEMVYGIDLVKGQLRVAQGEPLWFTQEDIVPRGHSIECRITAEDTLANFRPAIGTIGNYREPTGLGVRVDSGVRAGWTIPQHYDSLLSKLITWGQDRDEAISRMLRVLNDYVIEGVTTTIPFFKAALEHPVFLAGEATVNFIPDHPELFERIKELAGPSHVIMPTETEEDLIRSFNVEVNSRLFQVRVAEVGGPPMVVRAGGSASRGPARKSKAVRTDGAKAMAAPSNGVISPLQGVVGAIRTEPGATVEADQVIFVIQAMKMENEITSPKAGKIGEIRVEVGASVEAGAVLATYAEE